MEDEIDLRKYFSVLSRHWRLIVVIAVIAAAAGLGVGSVTPPTYEATALIVVTKPLYQLEFDPRIATTQDTGVASSNKSLPQLAISDDVLQKLFDRFRGQLPRQNLTLAEFKRGLNARNGTDASVIQLSAQNENPSLAAQLSNAWATDYVTCVNELYAQREAGATFFETQANEAKARLASAEQTLVDYQGRYDGSIIDSKLQASLNELSNALKTNELLADLRANTSLLKDRLSAQPSASSAKVADDLSSLLLQVSSLNISGSVPLQIQFTDATLLSSKTIDEQKSFLAGLDQSLQARAVQVTARINALTPQVQSLQHDLQMATTELDRLTRERDVARDTYLTLAKKVTESQISAQDTSGEVRLASQAAVPTEPIAPRKVVNTVLAGLVGLMVGAVAAFVIEARQPRIQVAAIGQMQFSLAAEEKERV